MAELVEQNMQETLREMSLMQKEGLLADTEIRKLIEKRREFEYKMIKEKKEKHDFIAYVLYECKLLELLKIRRERLGEMRRGRKIESSINRRILRRLRFMTRIWPNHLDLWDLRINFSKGQDFQDEVTSTFIEQIGFHGCQEDLWVSWAQWEMKDRRNFDKARDILLSKAPVYLPKSLLIARECFHLELLYIEYLKEKANATNLEGLEEIPAESRKEILGCAIPSAIYEEAKERFQTVDVSTEFYLVAERFPFADNLRELICSEMMSLYPKESSTWKLQAQRIIKGVVQGEQEDSEPTKLTPKEKILAIADIFDEAMDKAGPQFMPVCIDEFLNLLYFCWGMDSHMELIIAPLIHLMELHQSELNSFQWMLWYELLLLQKSPLKLVKDILCRAIIFHPDSSIIIVNVLQMALDKCKTDSERMAAFQKHIVNLKGVHAETAWMQLLSCLKNKTIRKETWIKGAVDPDQHVACKIRVAKLENISAKKDINYVRKYYKKYHLLPPYSTEFHICMLQRELKRKEVSLPDVRQIFDAVLKQFGRVQLGFWLSYIEFELKYGDALRASRLKAEAESYLENSKISRFIYFKVLLSDQTEKSEDNSTLKPEDNSEEEWKKSIIGSPFNNDAPSLMHSAWKERSAFFGRLRELEKVEKKKFRKERDYSEEWKQVLLLLGKSLPLDNVPVVAEGTHVEEEARKFLQGRATETRSKKDKYGQQGMLSGSLKTNLQRVDESLINEQVAEALATSLTLKPEFEREKLLPYRLSKHAKKKLNKIKNEETAGKDWFFMKAPEITKEVEQSLELIQNRSALDPRRRYKRNDNKILPKYFQSGVVVDSPYEFYSNRIPKKQRKQTLTEEIMQNEQIMRYQKRKYTEIVSKKARTVKKQRRIL